MQHYSDDELLQILESCDSADELEAFYSDYEDLASDRYTSPHRSESHEPNELFFAIEDPQSSTSHYSGNRGSEQVYQWTEESQSLRVPNFDYYQFGLNMEFSKCSTEIDFLQYFTDDEFMSLVVNMTNLHHNYFVLNVDLRTHSRLHKWYDVTISEMHIFFAIMMLMTRNRHLSIQEHWSSDELLHSPIFSQLMSRNRFSSILGMLHFSRRSEENHILSKINKCVKHSRQKFKSCITPSKNLCIDESVVPFKGRLSIKQYLPKKRNRFGIKLFLMCDVETGVIIDFIVYYGASTEVVDPSNLGIGGAVVATLTKDYFWSNRHVYVDNWYASPELFRFLHQHGIFACGTVKKNRKGMPKLNKKLNLHEMEVQYNAPLMAMKWRDKKNVHILSTIHNSDLEPTLIEDKTTGLPIMKPKAIVDYSKNMGTVDTADMLLSSLQCIRKTIKWYKKLFFRIFDMHLLNAFYCFKHVNNVPDLKFATFQLSTIRQLIGRYKNNSIERPFAESSWSNNRPHLLEKTTNHVPLFLKKYQRCKQCSMQKMRKNTRYSCKVCNVYLCAAPCFELFHTN